MNEFSHPKVIDTRRDTDGRLIEIIVGSTTENVNEASWLVAVDGSPHADEAVNRAIHLSLKMGTRRIILVHVHTWLSKEAAENDLLKFAMQNSVSARNSVEKAGLGWQLHAALGTSAEKIVEIAIQQNCFGISIGHRGMNFATSVLIGSCTHQVIQFSPLPVLVSKRPPTT